MGTSTIVQFGDDLAAYQVMAQNDTALVASLNLFRASELWGARMGTFLAQALPTPEFRSEALLHTVQELRHTYLFDRRIRELGGIPGPVPEEAIYLVRCAQVGVGLPVERVEGSPERVLAPEECIRLFAGVHVIEARGARTLRTFADAFPEDDPTRALLEDIMGEEAIHAASDGDALESFRQQGLASSVDAMLASCGENEPIAWRRFLNSAGEYVFRVEYEALGARK